MESLTNVNERPVRYVNAPPVEVIKSPGELKEICTEFINEVNRFGPPPEPPRISLWQRLRTPKKVIVEQQKTAWFEGELWLAQKNQPKFAAERMKEMGFYGYTFCAYKPDKVVGLMCWYDGLHKGHVSYLTMLPGYESHGTILVEYAVKLSNEAGYRGRTLFEQHSKGLIYRPEWLQYVKSETVDPQKSDDWDELDGEWRLKGLEKSFSSLLTKSARKVESPDLV